LAFDLVWGVRARLKEALRVLLWRDPQEYANRRTMRLAPITRSGNATTVLLI
jgi:hypothetical protein